MDQSRAAIYYAWSRPAEAAAPLAVVEDRFPTLFESRRMLYPHLQELADAEHFDQGISGFLDHVTKQNFAAFAAEATALTGRPVLELERVDEDGRTTLLDDEVLGTVDTVVVIGLDSLRTGQEGADSEVHAVRSFLDKPGNVLFVCPHHDVGEADGRTGPDLVHAREAEFLHHGDRTIPPRQGFGGFGRSLLAALGVPVTNRFGLRPAVEPDGSPAPIEIARELDRSRLLDGVTTFNLHPHLPHLERLGDAVGKMEVLARQRIDPAAPPHGFTADGRSTFDAMLQSAPGVFAGDLLVADATLWSSTAGGVDGLRRLWTNVVGRHADG